jgi:hypothetical protein
MSGKGKPNHPFENHPLAQAILREGLAIQDRFAAEPVYAKTGKGFLKSAGVEEIAAAKKTSKGTGR